LPREWKAPSSRDRRLEHLLQHAERLPADHVLLKQLQLDRVFGDEEKGYCYARHDNPTNSALEDLMCQLEKGDAALACASGMAALHTAVLCALTDRRLGPNAAPGPLGDC
jgi:cystathionine beta-lyase/cystathionine gamma-synthase